MPLDAPPPLGHRDPGVPTSEDQLRIEMSRQARRSERAVRNAAAESTTDILDDIGWGLVMAAAWIIGSAYGRRRARR